MDRVSASSQVAAVAVRPSRFKFGETTRLAATYGLLAVGGVVMIFPFVWMVSTSLKIPEQVSAIYFNLLPNPPTLANYVEAFTKHPFARYFLNSVMVTSAGVVTCVATSALAGYAFAKLRFPGRTLIFITIISMLMVPEQITIVPLFQVVRDLGLIDTYPGILASTYVTAFGVFLVTQFMQEIPDELLEAAEIDGASELQKFWHVVVPLSRPVLATLALFMFFTIWNDFLWPLVVINSTEMRTLPLGLALFTGKFHVAYGPLMAASTVVIMPVILVFVAIQKQVIESFAISGLKG